MSQNKEGGGEKKNVLGKERPQVVGSEQDHGTGCHRAPKKTKGGHYQKKKRKKVQGRQETAPKKGSVAPTLSEVRRRKSSRPSKKNSSFI